KPDEAVESPAETKPPETAITPLQRDGLMLETELAPLERELPLPPALESELAPPPAEGMPPPLDLTPASFDLELLSISVAPRACSRIHDRRFPTPVKIRSIGTAIRQTFFEGPDRLQTGHDSPPFLDIPLRRRSPAEVTWLWQGPGQIPLASAWKQASCVDSFAPVLRVETIGT